MLATLVDYLEKQEVGAERFESMYRYPFLVSVADQSHEKRPYGFETDLVTRNTARRHLDVLNELHRQGKSLHPHAELTLVFPVVKRPGAAFPDRITIGRTQVCDIAIPDRRISKMHAFIERDASGSYALVDGGSKNGTVVNGRRLAEGERATLKEGDRIELSPFAFRFVEAAALYALIHQSIEVPS